MLIGNLPRGYDPSKNDVIVFSKDGVHLLKIPYQDFLKGTGSGSEAGHKLKFFYETIYADTSYPQYQDTYFLEAYNHLPDPITWSSFPFTCTSYYADSANAHIEFNHASYGSVYIKRKGTAADACCATFSYHTSENIKMCGLYVKSTYEDDAVIQLCVAGSNSVIETFLPEEHTDGTYKILDIPKKYYVNYVEFATSTLTNSQGCNYYKDGSARSRIDEAYPTGATGEDCLSYCESFDGFSISSISFSDYVSSVGIGTGNYPWHVDTGLTETRNLIFWGGKTTYADTQSGYDRNKSAITMYDNGAIYSKDDFFYFEDVSSTSGHWVGVKEKIAELEGQSARILVGANPPSDTVGNNGNLFFVYDGGKKFKYLKFEITGQKTTNAYTQLAEIKFVDSNSNVADLHGLHCKANKPLYTYTQTNEMMFDGFTNTKGLWVASPTVNDPIIIECTLVESLDISVYKTLQLWTANDAEARDPSGWKLSVSNDKNTWYVVNQESNYTMTSTRQALGYSGSLTIPTAYQSFIKQAYYKDSNHWMPILI